MKGGSRSLGKCWVNKYRSFVDPAFVIIIIGKKGERAGGGTLGVTEKKKEKKEKNKKDWSGSILVVGCMCICIS